jgi:hypothetical protein
MKTFLKIIFAAVLAMWVAKIHYAREELKSWEMPDFKIEHVKETNVPWNGLAEARARADAAFSNKAAASPQKYGTNRTVDPLADDPRIDPETGLPKSPLTK